MTATTRAAEKAEEIASDSADLLAGQVPGDPDKAVGHPLHPATVHWPIAFLTACFGLTTITLLPANLYPSFFLPPPSAIPSLVHYSAGAAVLSSVPAIVTGAGEAYKLAKKEYKEKGSWEAVFDNSWNMKDDGGRKLKMTVKHASLNDVVIFLAAYNWYHGWAHPYDPIPAIVLALNAVAFPALLYSAMLGGRMVYEYGMGVQRQGAGKQVREKDE
ncbi:hypothetical protein BD324DRAFT_652899 [Kockovaella imperatae]|uniref:DUF2231 domain-containing protein n=1 Tax=Kockovaella imperatae TaxID=4999 RepID=A0A1Y1U9B9_9TREE|nr:hypothetical protein BD324DRAFT_652899 [Kockovaella imperatae]ORX34629.1 hypothetical protein BD324DRAFT_652899 [Kockovaella imperatae]